jgi:hypothetical protein
METWIRVLVPIAIVAVAIVVGRLSGRLRKPIHPEIVVGEGGERPGVVLFTSTDCSDCKSAIGRLKDMSVPYREITHELEPQRFEEWGVVAVPLTVVLDASGQTTAVIPGTPPKKALRRAMTDAGLAPPR